MREEDWTSRTLNAQGSPLLARIKPNVAFLGVDTVADPADPSDPAAQHEPGHNRRREPARPSYTVSTRAIQRHFLEFF